MAGARPVTIREGPHLLAQLRGRRRLAEFQDRAWLVAMPEWLEHMDLDGSLLLRFLSDTQALVHDHLLDDEPSRVEWRVVVL